MDTSQIYMKEGGYKGQPLTVLPNKYLAQLKEAGGRMAEAAEFELERRGTSYEDRPIQISDHCIDRLSLHALTAWEYRRKEGEGLFSWAVREGTEALKWNNVDPRGRYVHLGFRWVFDFRHEIPVLVTVFPTSRGFVPNGK